jgi:hypothetical protein
LLNLRHHTIGILFAGGIIDHHRRALCRQAFGDTRPDAFRGARNHGDLIREFIHLFLRFETELTVLLILIAI